MKKVPVHILIIIVLLISCSGNNKRIGIQPYEEADTEIIDTLQKTLQKTFGYPVVVLPAGKLPQNAYINVKSPRYRADSLLIDLKKNKPDSIDHVLGITIKDISATKRDQYGKIKLPESKYLDWGIMGLGYRPGPSCVVSTFRLKNSENEIFINRLKKVCIHELGHNLGLKHCITEKCVMQDAAETIKTIDLVSTELCSDCKRRLK